MNRQQRRHQNKGNGEIRDIAINQIEMDFSRFPIETQHLVLMERIRSNISETGHPLHHKTADGTIVDADPTLEHMMKNLKDVKYTIPVDRKHYGFDPYRGE